MSAITLFAMRLLVGVIVELRRRGVGRNKDGRIEYQDMTYIVFG